MVVLLGVYEAAVDSNMNISDVQKFTDLKSLVECLAREAISGLARISP